jgi:hypothetical protein
MDNSKGIFKDMLCIYILQGFLQYNEEMYNTLFSVTSNICKISTSFIFAGLVLSLAAPVTSEVFSFCCVAQRVEELHHQRNDMHWILKNERTIWLGCIFSNYF